MDVIVRSRQAQVSSKLRTFAERKVIGLGRLARGVARVEVDFSEERNPRISERHVCAITLHGRDGPITAHAAAPVPETAFALVLEKVRHQVERLKDRRVTRAHDARRISRRARTRS